MTGYSFLTLADQQSYKDHFVKNYCQSGPIITSMGFPVYFSPSNFEHAFFESTLRNGIKDSFYSPERCSRMDWVRLTLTDSAATWLQGFDKKTQSHDPWRTVCLAYDDFVVIVRLGRSAQGDLLGNFVTCFWADNSIGLIKQAPAWTPSQVP